MIKMSKELANVIEARLKVMGIATLPSQAAGLAETILEIFPLSMESIEKQIEEWQKETFPGATTDNVTKHLHEEMKEFWDARDRLLECTTSPTIEGAPDRICAPAEELQAKILDELADMTMLAIAYHIALGQSLTESLLAKHRENLERVFTYRPELGYAKALTPEEMSAPPAGWTQEEFDQVRFEAPDGNISEDVNLFIHQIASIQARKGSQ